MNDEGLLSSQSVHEAESRLWLLQGDACLGGSDLPLQTGESWLMPLPFLAVRMSPPGFSTDGHLPPLAGNGNPSFFPAESRGLGERPNHEPVPLVIIRTERIFSAANLFLGTTWPLLLTSSARRGGQSRVRRADSSARHGWTDGGWRSLGGPDSRRRAGRDAPRGRLGGCRGACCEPPGCIGTAGSGCGAGDSPAGVETSAGVSESPSLHSVGR
jgi:hypothetical protein